MIKNPPRKSASGQRAAYPARGSLLALRGRAARLMKRRGAVIVLISLMFVFLLALSGLSVDLGWVYAEEGRLVSACNAAAVAAANQLAGGGSAAQAKTSAKNFAAANGVALVDEDIVINPLNNNVGLVSVSRIRSVPLFFAPLIGTDRLNTSYQVYSMGFKDQTLIYSSPLPDDSASGLIPLAIPHADMMGVLQGTVGSKGALAQRIFGNAGAPTGFTVGDTYPLKVGQNFKGLLDGIVNTGAGASNQGALDFPGPSSGAQNYQDYFERGYGGDIPIGALIATQTGTISGPTDLANSFRFDQDPLAAYTSAASNTALAMSARSVVVPIANAYGVTGPDDVQVPNFRNLLYATNGNMSVQVIGFAKFFLDDSSTALGQGVVTGRFMGYVGTPPSGQVAGP